MLLNRGNYPNSAVLYVIGAEFGWESVSMKLYKKFVVALALLTAAAVFTPSTAEAGPLLDWVRL